MRNPFTPLPWPAAQPTDVALLNAGVLQGTIFDSVHFLSMVTDAQGVIKMFNPGAQRLLGYDAADVIDKLSPVDICDPHALVVRATAVDPERATHLTPGFEALVGKAAQGSEDAFALTCIAKDGRRIPVMVSVMALREAGGTALMGYLLLGHAVTGQKQDEACLQRERCQRAQTETQLQRSQLTLQQAARLAQLGAWSIELRDRERFDRNPATWSAEMYRLLDYTLAEVPAPNPLLYLARVHPDDRQSLRSTAWQAMAEQSPWHTEYRIVTANGIERVVQETGELTLDEAGNPVSMQGAVRDITAQRQVENALRDSVMQLRQTLEDAAAGNYEWNLKTRASFWSPEIWKLLGMAPSATPAGYESWRRAVHPEDLERTELMIEEAVTRGLAYEVEWRVNLPPGAPPRWLMDRARPVAGNPKGPIDRYRGILIDINKRKQAELALAQHGHDLEDRVLARSAELLAAEAEQRRLNRALRLLSDCNAAVVHAQSEGQLLDDLCRLVVERGGYLMAWVGVAEQDAAKTVRPVASFGDTSGYLDSIQLSWDAGLAIGRGPTGVAIQTGTAQVSRSDGTNLPQMAPWLTAARERGYQASVALPLIVDKQTMGTLNIYAPSLQAFSKDEVKLLEELTDNMAFGLQALRSRAQLARYRQHLEKLVAHRTAEIDALNTQLIAKARDAEAANLAKGKFLATMSHELRTPLNAFIGLTRLLADSPLNQSQRYYADKIQLTAQSMRALIDDLLDFAKIDAEELSLEQSAFSLNAILHSTAAVLGIGVGQKPIEALFDVAPDVPDALLGDALRLQQILLNLTSNAVKFTNAGEIVVSVRCLPRDEASQAARVRLQFTVRDTGIGIAPHYLRSIFDGFAQASTSTSRLYGGTGLGLTISARLASLMGGQIGVTSTLGQGSEFCLEVPLTLGRETPRVLPEGVPASLRLLIVDDHPLAREILTQACTTFGWQAHAVDSGAAALEALRQSAAQNREYDLLLLDWRMPVMDGLQMLRQAHATPGIDLPPALLMACVSELTQAVAASNDLTLGGIVAKPLTPGCLLEAVTRAYTGDNAGALPPRNNDRRLSGMRLLVAEDNALNQEVVEQILTRAGAEVVVVGHGVAAVAALRSASARFDAVLMDVQMPLMDGYTATRIIREGLGLVHLPIIAVTAFAQAHDREKTRLAGMVGHIVKPLDVEDLLELLAPRQGGAQRSPEGSSCALQYGRPEIEPASLAGLDIAAALKNFGGDEKKYADLLRKFLLLHEGDIDEARRRFNDGDRQGAFNLLHGLIGMSSLLQARELARVAVAAENALRDGPAAVMPVLFNELAAAMRTVKASFHQLEAFHG